MKKKLFAVVLTLCIVLSGLMCVSVASADIGDLVRFVPTEIEVTTNKVVVEGYFVNMNSNVSVKNFRELEMMVYQDGDLLVEGNFGTINEFTISPMRMKYQSFTFNGSHDLKNGSYTCNDRTYAVVNCRFTSVEN